MIAVRKPSQESIRRYLAAQASLSFTYRDVGATASTPPDSFTVDHTRVELGRGRTIFDRARQALERWEQFELGWVEAWPRDTPIRAGETVAILVRAFGGWLLNAARIVYVVDESTDSVERFGFAYGTLPGHAEMGEERFLVEWDRETGVVAYDIRAFSRPRHVLARLGRWQVRRMQKRFARDSVAALRSALE